MDWNANGSTKVKLDSGNVGAATIYNSSHGLQVSISGIGAYLITQATHNLEVVSKTLFASIDPTIVLPVHCSRSAFHSKFLHSGSQSEPQKPQK